MQQVSEKNLLMSNFTQTKPCSCVRRTVASGIYISLSLVSCSFATLNKISPNSLLCQLLSFFPLLILIPFSSASINQEGGCMSGELWSVLLFHFSITGLRSFPIQPQNFSHIDHSCLHVQLQTSFIFLADQNFKIKNQLVLIIFKTYRDLWNSKFSFVNKSDTNIINLLFTNISKHTVWTYSKRFILDSLLLKHS